MFTTLVCKNRNGPEILPGTNPVSRLPGRGTSSAASTGAIGKAEGGSSGARKIEVEASAQHVVFESTAFEAARAASEIVGSTIADGTVPVSGPDVGAAVAECGASSSAAVH